MFPVEASRELQVRVFHRLGARQYVLTLQLQSGDSVHTRVLDAFQQGRLPACLYRPTLEYAVLAVRESLSDHETPQPLPPPSAGCPVVGSGAALGEGLLDLEERRWPQPLACSPDRPAPTRDALFWRAYDFLLRHRPAFFRTIGTLEESYLKGVRELQAGRLAAISELQRCQSIEMEKKRQQAEKAAEGEVEECVSRDVQSLVAQHVSEIDAIELHWRTEIEQLKVRQKASYCDLIVDFFEQEIEQIGEVQETCEGGAEGGPTSWSCIRSRATRIGIPLCTKNLACPLLPRVSTTKSATSLLVASKMGASETPPLTTVDEIAGMGAPDDPRPPRNNRLLTMPRETRLLECAEVRALFGHQRVFFVLRLWVGDIMDLLQEVSLPAEPGSSDSWAANDADGAGPQLPPGLLGFPSYGHGYFARSSGLPVEGIGWPQIPASAFGGAPVGVGVSAIATHGLNKGQGVFRSPSLRFWDPPSLPPPVRLSPNAYASRLRGLVIPTPENLRFEALQAVMLREFASRCDKATDLHFPPLLAQLRLARAAARGGAPLRSGDYLCTRHSNLGGTVQAAFHLLTGSSEAPASDEVPAATHRALKRIVCDCHRCHVAELSLPLLLLDLGASESSLPYAVAQRRAENALRALKGALTRLAEELAPSEVPGLQVLNLVLPPSCAQSIKPGIPTVSETTLTFLQHSFQCV